MTDTQSKFRELAIALLDTDEGISQKQYFLLGRMAEAVELPASEWEWITKHVDEDDDRWFLKEFL